MLRRVAYVLLNYATRPLMWALGGIYLIFLAGALKETISKPMAGQIRPLQQAYPSVWGWGRQLIVQNPDTVRDFERDRFDHLITSAEIRWPTAFSTAGKNAPGELRDPAFAEMHLRLLQSCPNLRTLTLRSHPSVRFMLDDELPALGNLKSLERLSLDACDIRPGLWQQLGRLPRLRYLDLSGCVLYGDYPNLETLAHLETLVIRGFVENDASFLPELHRFPRLKTLVISSYVPAHIMRTLAPQMIPGSHVDPLNEHLKGIQAISTLQTMFVDDTASTFPGFDALQRDLPGIKARPSFVDADRQLGILILFILNMTLMFLLSLQIHSQLAQPAAHLAPNYVLPHFIPPICLWLFGILVHCIPPITYDVPFAAALGLNLLSWGILCGICLLGLRVQFRPSRLRWMRIPIGIAAAATFPMLIVALQWNLSSIDWYLRGREPVWTGLFSVCGIAITLTALLKSRRMYSVCLERGISSPPLSLDPTAMAAWQQETYWRQNSSNHQGWFLHLFSGRFDRAITQANQPGWCHRSNLWIAGNMGNGRAIWIVAMFAATAIAGTCFWLQDALSAEGSLRLQNPVTLVLSIFIPDLPVIVMAGIWRGRRKLLAVESLRPVSRNQFSLQIARALAWDLAPLFGIYLAVLTWYCVEADPQRWSWAWLASMLLVFVARWIIVYGLTLWAIVIRRDWVVILVFFVAGYALLFVNVALILLQGPMMGVKELPTDMPEIGVLALAALALGYGLIACAVTHFAYRRWQAIELT